MEKSVIGSEINYCHWESGMWRKIAESGKYVVLQVIPLDGKHFLVEYIKK